MGKSRRRLPNRIVLPMHDEIVIDVGTFPGLEEVVIAEANHRQFQTGRRQWLSHQARYLEMMEGITGVGTDIHLFAEWRIKTRTDEEYRLAVRNGEVEKVSKWVWLEKEKTPTSEDSYLRTWVDPVTGLLTDISVVDDRDYQLFSVLSGVRSYRYECEPLTHKLKQTGLPPDISKTDFQEEVEHSAGWLTVEQALADTIWVKDIETTHEGFAGMPVRRIDRVSPDFYEMLQKMRDAFPDMDGQHNGKDIRLIFYYDS